MRVRRRLRAVGRVVGAVLFVLVFNALAFSVMLVLPPSLGAVWGAALGTGFLLWQLRDDVGRRKRLALVRLRPVRASRRWLLVAVGGSVLVLLGLTGLIGYAEPPMDPDALRGWEPIVEYMSRPGAWAAAIVVMAVVAPLVEELCFRGYVQHTLERWWGAVPAVIVASALFMVAHLGRPHWSILLIPLTLGLANGAVVWLSRSIWPAVVIHGLWNLIMIGSTVFEDQVYPAFGDVGPTTLLAVSILQLALGLTGWAWLLRGGRARAVAARGREGGHPVGKDGARVDRNRVPGSS